MKTPSVFRLLAVASAVALACTPAFSQSDDFYYGGLSVGASRSKLDDFSLLGPAFTGPLTELSRDRNDRGWRVFGGRQLNQNFAIEAGYFNLGRFDFGATVPAVGGVSGSQRVQGVNLDLVGILPLTERLSILGRAGALYTRTGGSISAPLPLAASSVSERAGGAKLGLGLQYAFSPSFIVRGEVERYRVRDAGGRRGDVDLASVSLVFPFGQGPAPQRRAQAPMMVTQAPMAPPPVVAPPPPPPPPALAAPTVAPARAPAPQRVSYEAESLFGFDTAALRAEGQQGLDKLASELEGARYDNVRVEGHTDRLGSAAYNQALSLRRAEAVKEHLVRSGRVERSKITAVGLGAAQPVTKPGECAGTRRTAQLVACLQPDRRVEIEVVGTR